MNTAVVLLSGGLDSATVLALAKDHGFDVAAISFCYGQRHVIELEAASAVASHFEVVRHVVVDVDLRQFGGSALTDEVAVPKADSVEQIGGAIPVTYVPARNTVFLSMALAWAETLDARDIFIGVNAVDYSGYPDCRPEFIESFTRTANLGTKAGVEGGRPFVIHAPLIEMTKAQIITRGSALGVDYSLTTSCYDPTADGAARGHCDSCLLRRKGFADAGVSDPTRYAAD